MRSPQAYASPSTPAAEAAYADGHAIALCTSPGPPPQMATILVQVTEWGPSAGAACAAPPSPGPVYIHSVAAHPDPRVLTDSKVRLTERMDDPEWRPPPTFDDYRLVRRLGEGAMGEVYLAHDVVLDRPVAIKFVHALDAFARERFVVEARAAARLQHPNVMAIYRVGELDAHPYLITEYIRGDNLADLRLPLPEPQVRSLALGLARGLAAAHRQGVLHRDIKLANAILGEDNVVKLLDFSLAKLVDGPAAPAGPSGRSRLPASLDSTLPGSPPTFEVTGEGTLIGTPNYMAPELWRAEAATRRSDVYALGVLLYMLCTGQPPTFATSATELAERVQEAEPPPLLARAPTVSPAFAAVVDRCIRRDAAARFASGEELRAAIEALTSAVHGGPASAGNPYRGLRPFEAEHRDRFFGRDREILDVVDRLRGQPFVLVAGDSGVGKSSLCRAGVLPELDDGAVDSARRWRSAVVTPGRHPVHAIVDGLVLALGKLLPDLHDLVDRGDELERVVRRSLGRDRGCTLFVDQLEELVTLATPHASARAGRLLARLAANIPGLRVLATARGDFLTRLAQVPGLGDDLPRHLYFLRPLAAEGVRQAVVGPAHAQGVEFESEDLVDRLVTAGVEGSLPLLQFALAELWDARDPGSLTITTAALERIGGVDGALARHADSVLARLSAAERRAARALLLRLVTVDDTRASLGADELQAGDPAQRAALAALIAARLIVVRDTPGGAVHEIAHEALIRGWLTLQIWLDEDREARALRHRVEVAAAEWDRVARPADVLWPARQLAEAHLLDPATLRPREAEFLAASQARARRHRLLRGLALLAAPLIVVAAVLGIRVASRAELAREVTAHREAAAAAVAEAEAADATAATSRLTAFVAFDAFEREAGEAAWRDALAAQPAAMRAYNRAARELETALSLDRASEDLRRAFADVLLAQATILERDPTQTEALRALLERVALYDTDGAQLARWGAPAAVAITSDPPGAHVELFADTPGPEGRRTRGPARALGGTPLAPLSLPAGSYVLRFVADGAATVELPLLLHRGETVEITPRLPPTGDVPPGFVVIPAGRFLFGAAGDENLRKGFFNSVPLHERTTGPYLIARHEVTYADWIAFLDDLPPDERARRTPGAQSGGFQQIAALSQPAPGVWQLRVSKGDRVLTARAGEPLVYPARAVRAAQDWLRVPVAGIDWSDAAAYLAWLDRSGRVPGARFCSEVEWERAARGADGRPFPTGDHVGPEDANFDETYGRDYAAMGPDEVGSYPASASPQGLQDTMGNVFEWTTSAVVKDEKVARGGSYFFGALTDTAMNRSVFSADFRDSSLGLRVCSDLPRRR